MAKLRVNRSWKRKHHTMRQRRSSLMTRIRSRLSRRMTITMSLLLRRNSGTLMARWSKRPLRTHWNLWSLNTLEDSPKSTRTDLRSSCRRRRIIRISSLKTKSEIRRPLRTTRRSIRRSLPKSKRTTSGITSLRRKRSMIRTLPLWMKCMPRR